MILMCRRCVLFFVNCKVVAVGIDAVLLCVYSCTFFSMLVHDL